MIRSRVFPFRATACGLLIAMAGWCVAAQAAEKTPAAGQQAKWQIYVANDNCPDITWGWTEDQTFQAFTDLIAAHLDAMKKTDNEPWYNQDRYNSATTMEALSFVERCPERKEELIRRIKEGRYFVSPFLVNTMWAFQSFEGAVRSMYPARQLERDWGVEFKYAQHIELPGMPWGQATILAGCGIKGLTLPYLKYDSYFPNINTPPIFQFEGPDGSRVPVVLDHFASQDAYYAQGAKLLRKSQSIADDWLPHYAALKDYPAAKMILAAGTHGDISPKSCKQVPDFVAKLIAYNADSEAPAQLVSATYGQFWDKLLAAVPAESLPVVRGDFGHAWDTWPVSLSKFVADARQGDRDLVAAETTLAVAAAGKPQLIGETANRRQRSSYYWGLISDHAWNGTTPANQRHNAALRELWSGEMLQAAQDMFEVAWPTLVSSKDAQKLTVFNSLSAPRRGLIQLPLKGPAPTVKFGDETLKTQVVVEDGAPMLCFVSPEVPGFGFIELELATDPTAKAPEAAAAPAVAAAKPKNPWQVQGVELESKFYSLKTDPRTGGIGSLIHKPSGHQVMDGSTWRTLLQPIYSEVERDNPDVFINATKDYYFYWGDLDVRKLDDGPVLKRLSIKLKVKDIEITSYVTLYDELDRVDFDSRIHKPISKAEDRLLQYFPIDGQNGTLRVACTGAVVRPRWAPDGDVVPGADVKRYAVQEFINASGDDWSVTVAPLEPYLLRLDQGPPAFEPVGCDMNYREVTKDQREVTNFRARYSLSAAAGGYNEAQSYASARAAAQPLLWRQGGLAKTAPQKPIVSIDPQRALATNLKPAESPAEGGLILRLHEVGGASGPLVIDTVGFGRAVRTDLLERDQQPLEVVDGKVTIDLPAHGFAAIRLLP